MTRMALLTFGAVVFSWHVSALAIWIPASTVPSTSQALTIAMALVTGLAVAGLLRAVTSRPENALLSYLSTALPVGVGAAASVLVTISLS